MKKHKFMFINAIDNSKGTGDYIALGIGYLISSLRDKFGHNAIQFKVVEDNIESEIKDFNPDIIGISSVSANYNYAMKHAHIAKKYNLPVIVGGVHITMLPSTLTEDMDFGVIGEGEDTLCELFELFINGELFDKNKVQSVDGIVYRNKDGNIHQTQNRQLINPLDNIPLPSRDLLNVKPDAYMFTSRGCPYKCIFCSSTRFWDKVRLNSAKYVANEIEHLINEYKVKSIYFCDDIFIVSKKRVEEIIKLLEEKNLLGKITFICACRSNMIDENIVSLLKKLGVNKITLGFESGSSKILNYLKGDKVSVETHENAIKIIRNFKIDIMGGFIIGSPQETKEDILETINFIKRNKLVHVGIYPLSPLPGTEIWEYARKNNLVDEKMNWDLLSFTEFQNDYEKSIHLSENLSRKELNDFIQLFRRWRRMYILKSLIKTSLLNPLKIPGALAYLAKRLLVKIKNISTFQERS